MRMTMSRWLRRKPVSTALITDDKCCARSGAVPHDGPCQFCPKHDGSSSVDKVCYTDEYEDYSTDVRPLVLAKRR